MVLQRILLQLLALMSVASYINLGSRAEMIETDILFTSGPLSARVTDKMLDTNQCSSRKVEFMGFGVVLDEVDTTCDTPDRLMGLAQLDFALRYYDIVAVIKETDRSFLVVKKTSVSETEECSRTQYELDSNSYKVKGKTVSPDKSCKELTPFPSMMLLSTIGDVANYQPVGEDWTIFNPWEPLGFVSREYKLESKCFRLVVVTSYGRVVYGVKLTCGDLLDVTTNEISLYVGHSLYAKTDSPNKFIVLLNHHKMHCIEKTITLRKIKGGSESVPVDSKIIPLSTDRCKYLITFKTFDSNTKPRKTYRKLDFDTTAPIENVNEYKTKPTKTAYPNMLKSYTPSGPRLDYNVAMDLGIYVQDFTSAEGKATIVTVANKGGFLVPVKVEPGAPRHLVVRKDAVYYGKAVALTRSDSYRVKVSTVLGEGYCQCLEFTNGPYSHYEDRDRDIDAPPTLKEANCYDVTVCSELVKGTYLKTTFAAEMFGGLTDELGVPTSLLPIKAETNA